MIHCLTATVYAVVFIVNLRSLGDIALIPSLRKGKREFFYHQGIFHSVRRNPSLNCLHRRRSLAILGHAGPRWRIRLSLHLVLGLPCRLVHSRGVHSVTLFVHLLSLNRAMCPAHPCIPFLITSMMSFTPVGDPGITFVVT